MPDTEQRFMGGQAVIEGVMMRGADTWAVAVRTPDGEIELAVHDAPSWAQRWAKAPVMRGVMSLAESLGLGFKALAWSADRQLPEDERISSRAMGITMAISMILFSAIFLVAPALGTSALGNALGIEGFSYHLVEGAVRLAIFLAYLIGIGFLPDIKRVFMYHGAEHKVIAAYENGVELTPESAQQFTTQHVRCGTNFLLTVMVTTIFVYSLVGRPALPILVASRIILLPLVAGLAYEVIRFSARNMHRVWVRVLMKPGLLLQKLTTREPELDQLEVAITSLRAVFTAEQIAEVAARRPVPVGARGVVPAFGTA